jgi:hypothetical protein
VPGFPCGGWCPAGRRAEDGKIPERYPLIPLPEADIGLPVSPRKVAEQYRARTLKNVRDSDGTGILHSGTLSGGTLLTRNVCMREKKPYVALDAQRLTASADTILRVLEEQGVGVLNVAGPCASGWAEGYAFKRLIGEVISSV